MRIFRVGSKNRKLRKQNSLTSKQHPIDAIPSIGSELAASDQFEIIVARRASEGIGDTHRNKKSKHGFLSYFSSDNDDSTVSSITTVEYGSFFHSKRPYSIRTATTAAAASLSSWCCCGESSSCDNQTTGAATRRTHPSSTDNTLIQHSTYGGTLHPSDSRSQMQYRSMSGSRCCGPDGSVSPIRRQRSFLFANWGRSSRNNNNNSNNNNNNYFAANSSIKNVPNMSASLFDDLSEDELDIHAKRSTSFSVGRRTSKKNVPDASFKSVSLRRAMTWKRKVL